MQNRRCLCLSFVSSAGGIIFVQRERKRGFAGLSFLFSGVYGAKDSFFCDTFSFFCDTYRRFFPYKRPESGRFWSFHAAFRAFFEATQDVAKVFYKKIRFLCHGCAAVLSQEESLNAFPHPISLRPSSLAPPLQNKI